jgi:hypothetical protein
VQQGPSQMSRPKSLAEQQQDFKRNLLSQAKSLQNISEARSAQPTAAKTHAYGMGLNYVAHL